MLTPIQSRLLVLAAFLLAGSTAHTQVVSLDGPWAFAVDSAGAFTPDDVHERAHWREATVPLPWQAQFADLREYLGVAWYRRTFEAPALGPDETAILHFGAVDYLAEVFVNGTRVGRHEGGFTPFRFDVGALLRPGENEVVVRVVEPVVAPGNTEGLTFEEVPHGKQSWYVNVGGIWQSVWLEKRPRRHVERVHVTPEVDGTLRVDVALAGEGAAPLTLRVFGPDGQEVLREEARPEAAARRVVIEGAVPEPALWSPDAPNLYTAEVTLGADRVQERFGFRSIETRDGRIYLNGAPFFLLGALDQDFYPGTIYTSPSEEYLRDQMRKAKALGLNTLRMHVKIPDPRYLDLADEEGLLVWLDLPNHWTWTPDAARRLEATFDEWLARDWNHPSLAIVSLINESWGVDLGEAEQRAWLLGFYARAKAAVPGWLVVDNSACWGNFHLQTDLADWHTYWAIPENRYRFNETVWELAQRPDWLFSPHGDAVQTGEEPIILSEFGNWGLPNVPERLPWWLDHGMDDLDVTIPTGVHDRFRAYGYESIFGTYEALAEASQRAQARALKYEIETLRSKPGIAGYVITELTDLHWESNGLLDMERNVKAGMEALAPLQQQDVLVTRPDTPSYAAKTVVQVVGVVSHYSSAAADSTILRWRTEAGESGEVQLGPFGSREVRRLPVISVRLPDVDRAKPLRIAFRWEDARGRLLAENELEVFVYPGLDIVRARVQGSAARLGGLAHFVQPDSTVDVLVAKDLDTRVLDHLEAGGRAVVFADSQTVLPEGFPLRLVSREKELWDGNWVSNLNWVRHDRPPFVGIAFGPALGFEAADVDLAHVIDGIPPEHFEDVLAGMFVGWIQRNAGYVVQMNVGAGRLLLVTMLPRVPVLRGWDGLYARHLVRALVDYAGSDAFRPRLTWTP